MTATTARPPMTARRASRRKLTTPDYQALGAFRLALRRFLAFSEAGARALGLTPQQHQALLAIRAHAGLKAMSVGELAESLLIKNHSALGLVDRLVERGLLVRAAAPHDRRRVALTLTEAGAQALETISRNNLGKLKSTIPVFTDLLQALEQLDLPSPREVEASRGRKGRPRPQA
ncbi:MarR family winged helix-turn-helix transcriptional regulator [Phenylobacterium sp.]|uniref:MarR family winged helix-turn-helix transcriptional regulator n=1 Tax=Phenylobacterium sp. TaxID=1871053 RepID=UPI002ED92BDD